MSPIGAGQLASRSASLTGVSFVSRQDTGPGSADGTTGQVAAVAP